MHARIKKAGKGPQTVCEGRHRPRRFVVVRVLGGAEDGYCSDASSKAPPAESIGVGVTFTQKALSVVKRSAESAAVYERTTVIHSANSNATCLEIAFRCTKVLMPHVTSPTQPLRALPSCCCPHRAPVSLVPLYRAPDSIVPLSSSFRFPLPLSPSPCCVSLFTLCCPLPRALCSSR